MFIQDKHLKDIAPSNGFGEFQIAAEIVACAHENICRRERCVSQILFAIRVLATYVTFYRAELSKHYLDEVIQGLPIRKSLEIRRWPAKNSVPEAGYNLTSPDDRRAVLTALARIRKHLLLHDAVLNDAP